MKPRAAYVVTFGLLFATSAVTSAAPTNDSWIFRSTVADGQNMWGPGTSNRFEATERFTVDSGIIKGTGLEVALMLDSGTLSGNVEGLITAQYDNHLAGPGRTNVSLSYTGIQKESKISTSFGALLKATPRLVVDFPWWVHLIPPFPTDIDITFNATALNVSATTDTEFTTGLGQTSYGGKDWPLLPIKYSLLVEAGFDLGLKQDITFTPETITGTMTYTHLETQTAKEAAVVFAADLTPQSFEVDLDLPGLWEFSLEDFLLADNTFSQDVDAFLEVGIGIPLLGAEWSYQTTLFDYIPFGEFSLDFLAHGYDGVDSTVDRLGRFYVNVGTGAGPAVVPIPGAVGMLSLGLLCLSGMRRRLRILGSHESSSR